MRLEVSLTVVAAVLSMVGYSLNDTIIIFDRVRENLKKHKKETFEHDPQPLDQRDPAAQRADPRHDAVHAARADHLRRRGDPAVRAGHVLRRVHRHVLVDLHRLAGADGHREALAGRARAGPHGARRRRAPAPADGRPQPVGSRVAGQRRGSRDARARERAPIVPRLCSIDTHCHLADSAYDPDRAEVLERAWAAGVDADRGRSASRRTAADRALALAAAEPRLVATAGVHPHDAAPWSAGDRADWLRERLRRPGGRRRRRDGARLPLRSFAARRRSAAPSRRSSPWRREAGKPAVIHAREADDDVAAILARPPGRGRHPALVQQRPGLLRAGLVLRHYVSFSGMVTFKNWRLDQAILETPARPAAGGDRRALPRARAAPRQAQRAGLRAPRRRSGSPRCAACVEELIADARAENARARSSAFVDTVPRSRRDSHRQADRAVRHRHRAGRQAAPHRRGRRRARARRPTTSCRTDATRPRSAPRRSRGGSPRAGWCW